MATMAAVDLGAQSGRVAVGRFDGERLDVTEVHRFPNVPVRTRGTLHWDVLRLFGDVLDGLRARRARGGASTRSASTPGASTSACSTATGRLVAEPGALPRRAPRPRDRRRARSGCPRASSTSAPASSSCRSTRSSSWPRWRPSDDPALDVGRDAADDPRPLPLLALRQRASPSSRTRRRRSASTRAPGPGRPTCSSGSASRRGCCRRSCRPATRARRRSRRTSPRRRGSAGRRWSRARRTTPARPSPRSRFREPGSAFISAGTWSLVGARGCPARDRRRDLRREPDQRGRRRRHRSACCATSPVSGCCTSAAAPGRVEGSELLVRRARRARRRTRRRCARSSTRTTRRSPTPGDMPRAHRASSARARGQPEPATPGAVVRCILESLALKHAETVDLLAAVTGATPRELHVVGGGARNELLCRWTASAAGLPVLAGPEEATLLGNLLVQAMALGELGSLDEAREVVRASFERRTYEPDRSSRAGARRASGSPTVASGGGGGGVRPPACCDGIAAPEDRWDAAAAERARPARRRSSTARTCSAPTARSRTSAAATRLRRGRSPTTPAARCACSGSRARAPTSPRSRRRASPCLRLDEVLPLRERDEMDDATMVDYLRPLRAYGPTSRGRRSRRCCTRFVPAPHVDHTHPDAVIALTSTPERPAARRGGLRRRGRLARLPAARLRHVAPDRRAARREPGGARRAARRSTGS